MTASSLEFFPCRVRLMGLPRSITSDAPCSNERLSASSRLNQTNAALFANTHRSRTPIRGVVPTVPPKVKLRRISRNLFGTPDRTEMNKMYKEEVQQQRLYVKQRYNFNIDVTQPSKEKLCDYNRCHTNEIQSTKNIAIPDLIERELEQHEHRLRKEKCSLIRSVEATIPNKEVVPIMCKNRPENIQISRNKIVRYRNKNFNNIANDTCCKNLSTAAVSQFIVSERYRPYERQLLITDCYSVRKNNSCEMTGEGNKIIEADDNKNTNVKSNQKMRFLSTLSSQQNFTIHKKIAEATINIRDQSSRICRKMQDQNKNMNDIERNTDNSCFNVNNNTYYKDESNNHLSTGSVMDIHGNMHFTKCANGYNDAHTEGITTIPEMS